MLYPVYFTKDELAGCFAALTIMSTILGDPDMISAIEKLKLSAESNQP